MGRFPLAGIPAVPGFFPCASDPPTHHREMVGTVLLLTSNSLVICRQEAEGAASWGGDLWGQSSSIFPK